MNAEKTRWLTTLTTKRLPNLKRWRPAGGISKVSSNLCIALTRCVWAISPERSGGLFGKKCSTSAAAAASWPESMAREGATVTGLDMGFEPLQVAGCLMRWSPAFR